MQIYGSIGKCEKCGKARRKLQCRVKGVIHCVRCYSRHRYNSPKHRKLHRLAVQKYHRTHRAERLRKMREWAKIRRRKNAPRRKDGSLGSKKPVKNALAGK